MAALAAAVLVVPAGPPAGGQTPLEQTPLEQAQEDAVRARDAYDRVSDELDQLAAQYESALDHSQRLQTELRGADDAVEDAQAELEAAQAARRAHIREAYMTPGLTLIRQSSPFLAAADIGTALHVSRMLEMVADARVTTERRASVAADNTAANVATQQGILGGTAAAMEDLRSMGSVFSDALEDATADVVAAEAAVVDAEAAERRAEELAQMRGTTGFVDGGALGLLPPPPIREATIPGGTQLMACPIGLPNGFIDSWGFPRSGGRRHQGVDMFAAYGMPLYATADGVVTRVWNNRLGGLSIDLVDGLGNRYYYAHLSAAYVVDGQQVGVGQLIAANGQSGNAAGTPPHLHWQFHPGGGPPTNPFPLAAALCR